MSATAVRSRARRYPLGPLEQLLHGEDGASINRTADRLGVDRRAVCRWRKLGIPELRADEIAVALGLHPSAVWLEWWITDVEEVTA